MASKTTFLREQISSWDWNPSTDIVFQNLKQWICKTLLNTALTYFDHTKPVVIQTDASEYGLGATLLQEGRPIAFASKTLTDVEARYTNIEAKCLSVCFGLENFIHMYMVDTLQYRMITNVTCLEQTYMVISLNFSLILSQFYISKVLHIRWISLLICAAQDGYVFCVGYW